MMLGAATTVFAGDVANMWKAASPDSTFLAVTRRVPEPVFFWREDLDGTKLVIFRLGADSNHAVGNMYFDSSIPHRIPYQIAWTPDSKYIVFTSASSGGHSPWHDNAYVFSVSDRKLLSVDELIGLVVSPIFEVKPPHTVVFGIGKTGPDGVDFDHPVRKSVDLSTLFLVPSHKR